MIARIAIFHLALLTFAVVMAAQEKYAVNPDAEKAFSHAVRAFSENRFDQAAEEFDALRKARPMHQRTTASYCMASKAYFHLKEYTTSYAIAQDFLLQFPASSYRSDAQYFVALNALMFQKYPESLRYLLQASEHAPDTTLRREVSKMITWVSEGRVSMEEKQKMFSAETTYYSRSFLALLIAEGYAQRGEYGNSNGFLREVVIVDSTDELAHRTMALRARIGKVLRLKIGALLPRSRSSVKGVADEMLEGMEFALAESARRSPLAPQLSIEVQDSDLDSSAFEQGVKKLAESNDVAAIVGPLFSGLALQIAPLAIHARIPMVSPTATADGIAGTGRYVFQLNPDYSTRGKAMARYAVQVLGFMKLGVLASSDPKAATVAAAFDSEAVRLGAAIVVSQTYGRDTTDLREQLIAIRRGVIDTVPRISFAGKMSKDLLALMQKAGADQAVMNRARKRNEAVEVTKLLGPNGVRIADSLQLPVIPAADQATTLEIPATELDALFVAITGSEELSVVAPQISYFNIKTQLLGSAEWFDPAALEANKRYVEEAIFVADTYIDKTDSSYLEFVRGFTLEKSKSPTKNTVVGYDTMRLIAELVARGAITREDLATALAAVEKFEGLHSTVTLRDGRVNSSVHILKYRRGETDKISEVSVH